MSNSKMSGQQQGVYRNPMMCDCSIKQLQHERMSQVSMDQYGMGQLKKKVSVSGTLRNNIQNSLKKKGIDPNLPKAKDSHGGSSQKKIAPRIQQFSAQQNHPLFSNQPSSGNDQWRQKKLSPSPTMLHVMRLPRHEVIKRPQIHQVFSPPSHMLYMDRMSPAYRHISKKPQQLSGKATGGVSSDQKLSSRLLQVPANKISSISHQFTSAETDTNLWHSGTQSEIQNNAIRNGIELREVHSIYGDSEIHERSVEQSLDESMEAANKIAFSGLLPDFSKIRIARSTYRKETEPPQRSGQKQNQIEV